MRNINSNLSEKNFQDPSQKPRYSEATCSFISWQHQCHSRDSWLESLPNAIAVLRTRKSDLRHPPSEWLDYKLESIHQCASSCDIGLRTCGDRVVALYRCNSPTCLFCNRKDMERNLAKYAPILGHFKKPVFMTFTVGSNKNLRIALNRLYDGVERFRDIRIGKRNLAKWRRWMSEELGRYFTLQLWELLELGLWHEAFVRLAWKKVELQVRFWKRFEKKCKEFMGKEILNLRLYHLLTGLVKLENTYKKYVGHHPHFHCVFDGFFIPQILLSRMWKELTGSYVVDIRSAYKNYNQELLKYVSKPWELEGLSDNEKGQFLYALSNRKKVLIFGLKLTNIANKYCSNCGKRKGIECKCVFYSQVVKKEAEEHERVRSVTSIYRDEAFKRINFSEDGKPARLTYERYMKMRKEPDEFLGGTWGVEIFWDFEKKKLSWRTRQEFLCSQGLYSACEDDGIVIELLQKGLNDTS